MALVKLEQEGLLKFCVSQNVDGLHRRSGFSPLKLAELHGNTNLEKCKNSKCEKQYLRDYRCRNSQFVHDHKTGRSCEKCNGPLYDSIINFGESLPQGDRKNGFLHCEKADLCLVLGSSLRVDPAADMPLKTINNGGELVIVNLQATPMDSSALRINGMIDKVMIKLMAKLNMEIPKFMLKRRMGVRLVDNKILKKKGMLIRGLDSDGSNYSLFTQVVVSFPSQNEDILMKKEPFQVFPDKANLEKEEMAKLKLSFQGHYSEPDLSLDVPLGVLSCEKEFLFGMDYDPKVGKWSVYNLE